MQKTRKRFIGSDPHDQVSLFPAWRPWDRVEITGTGLHGTIMAPVGARADLFYVRLDPHPGQDSHYSRHLVQVNAMGMRKEGIA